MDQSINNVNEIYHTIFTLKAPLVFAQTALIEIDLKRIFLNVFTLVFILCHSVKWIPNIWELVTDWQSGKVSNFRRFFVLLFLTSSHLTRPCQMYSAR